MDVKNDQRTLEEFTKELADRVQVIMKEEYGVSVDPLVHMVQKTNVQRMGITVRFEDSNISPTVYTEDMYKAHKDSQDLDQMAKGVAHMALEAHLNSPSMPVLTSEEAQKHITLTLVNSKLNIEVLEKTPHMDILGGELAAIPRWIVSPEASFVVTTELAGQMMLTPDEVLRIGQNNINRPHFEAKSMSQILSDFMGGEAPLVSVGPEMIVLTSDTGVQGASALLSEEALNRVHKMIGDYVILPSSVLEVICVPVSEDMHPDDLRAMVREVNETILEPEQKLSDGIMLYDGQKLMMVRDSLQMERSKDDSVKIDLESSRGLKM